MSLGQIVIGIIKSGTLGLITGQVISYFFGISILSRNVPNLRATLNKINVSSIKEQARIYKKFPIFSLPSTFVNTTTLNLTPILISSFFSVTTLGFYSLSLRIIGVPSRVLGNSFSQVFYQKATELFNKKHKIEPIFIKTLRKLVLVGVPCFVFLFFFIEPLFEIIFGTDWKLSGTYAKILIPLAAARFLCSSLSPIANVLQKQHIAFFINVCLLLATVSFFLYAQKFNTDFNRLLTYMTYFLGGIYLSAIGIYWHLVRKSDRLHIYE